MAATNSGDPGNERSERTTSTSRRLAIFVHFDAQNEVKAYILHHLRGLQSVCTSTVFVSNSPIGDGDRQILEGLCSQVITRNNLGYDFSAWRDAIQAIQVADWDEIALTNSSVFGPVFPLQGVFSQMRSADVDFWAMTENAEHPAHPAHLQSYFLVFRRSALTTPAFASFWSSILPFRDKFQTIRSYEVGLTTYFSEQGLRYASFIPKGALATKWPGRKIFDLTLSRPLELLNLGMPYVKVSLLRDNPKRANLTAIYRKLAAIGYDRSLIQFDRAAGSFLVEG